MANVVKTFIWNDTVNQPMLLTYETKKRLSNDKPFKCNQCGHSFKAKKYLNEHLKDHVSAKSTNICQFCNKFFLTYRSLQQHLRTQHLNRRKFLCSQCPASFITKGSLIRHGLVHSKLKQYACSFCFRQFKARIYCDRHIAAMKCVKKLKSEKVLDNENLTVAHIIKDPFNSEILRISKPEQFQSIRLEDLDINISQASSIPVRNHMNEYSSISSSDKQRSTLDNLNFKNTVQSVHHKQQYEGGSDRSNIPYDKTAIINLAWTHAEAESHETDNVTDHLGGQLGVTSTSLDSADSPRKRNSNIGQLLNSNLIDPMYSQASGNQDYSRHVLTTGLMPKDVYYQPVNEFYSTNSFRESTKISLADKFPILKASLFSDDEFNESNSQENSNKCKQFSKNATSNQLVIKSNLLRPVSVDIAASIGTGNTDTVCHEYQNDFTMGQRQYHGCANCDEKFHNSDSLTVHVKSTHKISNDYECTICQKGFSAKLSLWAHSKTHLESRSFRTLVCIACNGRFISVSSLSRHVRMQHNDNLNLYRCTHCNRVYKTTRELDAHVKQLISEYNALIFHSKLVQMSN